MKYSTILSSEIDNELPLRREIVLDDVQFAQMILDLTASCGLHRPNSVQNPQTVRANLCEYCVWELGAEHWRLYSKKLSWPANTDPWRRHSDAGIDILAVDENVELLMVIEVKSSEHDGSDLVNDESKGLKGDFKSLFVEDGRTRLQTRIFGDVAHSLKYHQERPDLAEKVGSLFGSSPSRSPNTRIFGIVVCGDQNAQDKRRRAFERLHNWLLNGDGDDEQKWQADQCKYFTIELSSLPAWLNHLLSRSDTENDELRKHLAKF